MDEYENAIAGWGLGQQAGTKPVSPKNTTKNTDDDDDGFAFGTTQNVVKNPEHFAALERIREWTKQRFSLPDDAGILVSEVECNLPGCPPLETVVAFWTEPEKRYHFKMFKNATEVGEDDIPFAWLKETLLTQDGFGCECC
jgi:hypothetical protein